MIIGSDTEPVCSVFCNLHNDAYKEGCQPVMEERHMDSLVLGELVMPNGNETVSRKIPPFQRALDDDPNRIDPSDYLYVFGSTPNGGAAAKLYKCD
jgi:hypothetical protein